MRTYILTKGLAKRFRNQGRTPICWHCGKGFSVGKKVLAKISNGRTRYWHEYCWEATRI